MTPILFDSCMAIIILISHIVKLAIKQYTLADGATTGAMGFRKYINRLLGDSCSACDKLPC